MNSNNKKEIDRLLADYDVDVDLYISSILLYVFEYPSNYTHAKLPPQVKHMIHRFANTFYPTLEDVGVLDWSDDLPFNLHEHSRREKMHLFGVQLSELESK